MTTFELITQWASILSPIIAVALAWWTVRSSNKSTRLMLKGTRENSRVTSSEHLSLYRIEAFYNAVSIRNLLFDIETLKKQITTEKKKAQVETLKRELQRKEMNLQFMKIREQKLIHADFSLQEELQNLFKDIEE